MELPAIDETNLVEAGIFHSSASATALAVKTLRHATAGPPELFGELVAVEATSTRGNHTQGHMCFDSPNQQPFALGPTLPKHSE